MIALRRAFRREQTLAEVELNMSVSQILSEELEEDFLIHG
jgi:hypothetical protein